MKRSFDQASLSPGGIAGITALAAAGALALLSASCCVLPIGLSVLGLGGAWLVVLGPVVVYRTPLLVGAALVIGLGWLGLLARRRHAGSRRAGFLAATLASASLVLALSAPFWEQQATRYLFELWILRQ